MVEGQRRPKMQARPTAHGTKVLVHAVFVEHIPLHAAQGLETRIRFGALAVGVARRGRLELCRRTRHRARHAPLTRHVKA